MKGNHKPFLGSDILDDHYFSHASTVEPMTRYRIPFAREISRTARRYIKDYSFRQPFRLDHISSKEITFKVASLYYEDLLSIASGRFSPEIVYKGMN
jgi:hypothetical protein